MRGGSSVGTESVGNSEGALPVFELHRGEISLLVREVVLTRDDVGGRQDSIQPQRAEATD